MSIHILPEETVNKIAAGEVVENPASVVKELVENSIDAKATCITVEVKAGGFSLIRVSDNGEGIERKDLSLSLERHATSKIHSARDLHSVSSMGFRGEALASIASISHLRIVSYSKKDAVGGEIYCNGGKLGESKDSVRDIGTTIEVGSVFYNVPARKKFQKSCNASKIEIFKTLTKLSLANPKCSLKYFSDEREVLCSRITTLEGTCKEILGERFLQGMSTVQYEENSCHFNGYLGAPFDARRNRLGQYLFVNGRGVICPEISRAIYDVYGTRLDTGSHPTFVLHLTLPPEWLDVNVHPQKKEIRLRERSSIQEVVSKGASRALQGKKREEVEPPLRLQPFKFDFPTPPLYQNVQKKDEEEFFFEREMVELPIIGQFHHFLFLDGRRVDLSLPLSSPPYDGIILVDLQAAYASILFERFCSSDIGALQTLMVPHTIEFTPHECEELKIHLQEIKNMGIEMRPFGKNCLIVEALSPEIDETLLKPLLYELLQVFDQKSVEKERKKKLALTLSRCAKSQKKGWTTIEAKHLVQNLLKTSSPYLCPRGKQTMVHISYDTITRFFQRAN